MSEDDIPDYKLREISEKTERKEDIPFSVSQSLNEYLLQQLGLRDLPEKQVKIAEYIIGNIDDDGYLRRELPPLPTTWSSRPDKTLTRRNRRSPRHHTRFRPSRSRSPQPAGMFIAATRPERTDAGNRYGDPYPHGIFRRIHPQALRQDHARPQHQ